MNKLQKDTLTIYYERWQKARYALDNAGKIPFKEWHELEVANDLSELALQDLIIMYKGEEMALCDLPYDMTPESFIQSL